MFLGQEEIKDYSAQGDRRENRIYTTGVGEGRGITGGGAAAAPSYDTNGGAIKSSRGGEKPFESLHGYYRSYINCENQIEITSQSLHELAVSSETFKLPSSPSEMQSNALGLGSIGVSPKPAFSKIPTQISEAGSHMLIGATSQEVYRDTHEPLHAFQFGGISPGFVNGMQNPLQESQVQGRIYGHPNGLPFPSSNHYHIAGGINSVQFQQTQTQSVAAQMHCSVPSSQAQISGDTLEKLSSLQLPALHSQQAMMMQGQYLRLQQPMHLHTSHGAPQHLNPIAFQLPMQQLVRIAHPVSSRTSVGIGSGQPSQIPGTQFGPLFENQYINPHLNKAIKITHPETHEELRFDSKSKKSESYMDSCVVSFPGSPIMPQRTAATHSPQLYPPVHSQTQNFYSAQERSYRHAVPAYYQNLKPPIPMGSLRVPEQNTAFSALDTQPLVHTTSIGTPWISALHGHAMPISLATDNDRVQSVLPLPAEKNIIASSSFIQVDDAHLPNSTYVTCSGQLDSSKNLPPGNWRSSVTQSGLLSSLSSETSALSCDIERSVVDSATYGIKQPIPSTAVSIRLTPAVDMASSNASVSAPRGGPKVSNYRSQEGESIITLSPTTMEHSKKSNKTKIQRKSSSASKCENPKKALVTSSAVISSHSFVNNSPSDGRPSVLQLSGNLNEGGPFNAEASKLSAERTTPTAGHVNCCQVSDDKVVNESIEHLRPVDVAQITQTNFNLDASTRNLELEKAAEMVNLDNFSVNSIISSNGVLLVGNHLADAYECQRNGIAKFDSTSAAFSLHGNSNTITKSREVFKSNTFLEKSPPAAEKTDELISPVVLSEITDGPNGKQLDSGVSMSQEHSLKAVDEQSTLQEPCIKENENGLGTTLQFKQVDSSQVKEVAAHEVETHCEFGHESGEAMFMHEAPFTTESERKKVSDGARKRASVNLKDKPVGLTLSGKAKVESVPLMSNSQPSSGSGMKHTGSKKKKKKKKNCLAREDASCSTGDLYNLANACKAPEKQNDCVNRPNTCDFAKLSVKGKHSVRFVKKIQMKLDDREGLDELPTENNLMENRFVNLTKMVQVGVPKARNLEYRKYSRDFLLTFKDQFRNLPSHYEIQADLAGHLFKFSGFARHSYEPLNSGNKSKHVFNNLVTDNRKIRSGGYFSLHHDIQMEDSPAWPARGFRQRRGFNPRLKRNVHGASVKPSTPACIPGDPVRQISVPLGDIPRNACDADRWQHSSVSLQEDFFPTWNNLPAIHRAKKKYEIGKVSDEENSKQRQIKAILNKLTPQNFDKLFYQVKEVNIDSVFTLTGVISQIFDKALMEPTFCEMYAKFCFNLAAELPEFNDNNEKITFKRVLLSRCQEEFQRDERECEEADKIEEDVEVEQSNEYREHMQITARRRMLGNIRFIGELYKISMLSERIMHECIKKLLREHENPDEEDVEALCKLMSTIGHMIDQSKTREHIDVYFEIMTRLCNNQNLPSRLRFMLKDVIDLRKNGWQQRTRVEGPKMIEEVHRDAVQQRQAHSVRSKHGHASGSSGRKVRSLYDHASQKFTSSEFSSCQPIGSVQNIQEAQLHMGYGRKDVRLEGRLVSERKSRRKKSTHKPSDIPLTLGPQGGLTRGVINGEHPFPLKQNKAADAYQVSPVDNRQANLGQMIGWSNHIDCEGLAQRDEYISNSCSVAVTPNSFEPSSMPSVQERNSINSMSEKFRKQECYDGNSKVMENNVSQLQDSLDKTPMAKHGLRERSDMAINEYYSVRDMDEAALCVTNLKAASFHSDMVSQWMRDSFDRKDVERDLLSKLLVHLNKKKPSVLNHDQLIRGIAISLSSLEDTIVDEPRAPDFFGGILGKIVVAEILSFAECTTIIKEGGDLLRPGLALDIVTRVLNVVKKESGEAAMTDMYKASKLRLEDFMPCGKNRNKLESLLKKKNLQCLYPVSIRRR